MASDPRLMVKVWEVSVFRVGCHDPVIEAHGAIFFWNIHAIGDAGISNRNDILDGSTPQA